MNTKFGILTPVKEVIESLLYGDVTVCNIKREMNQQNFPTFCIKDSRIHWQKQTVEFISFIINIQNTIADNIMPIQRTKDGERQIYVNNKIPNKEP